MSTWEEKETEKERIHRARIIGRREGAAWVIILLVVSVLLRKYFF